MIRPSLELYFDQFSIDPRARPTNEVLRISLGVQTYLSTPFEQPVESIGGTLLARAPASGDALESKYLVPVSPRGASLLFSIVFCGITCILCRDVHVQQGWKERVVSSSRSATLSLLEYLDFGLG